jgi:hypothetical protein
MAQSPKTKRKVEAETQVRRKTGVARVELKSESIYLHMRGQSGDALNNSLYRLGELFKMTNRSSNKTTYNTLMQWFEKEIISTSNKDIEKLVSYFDSLQENILPGFEFIDIKNPDMALEINIIHKSHLEIINIISRVDLIMDDIEALSLSGSWEDDIEQSARNQALLILNNISSRIFKATKPGKRNGGPFSPVVFLEGLQNGVFTLYQESDVTDDNVVNIDDKSQTTKDENIQVEDNNKTSTSNAELTEAV